MDTVQKALDKAFSILEPWSKRHRHERFYYRQICSLVLKYCPKGDSRVIDVGCGVGVIALALKILGYEVHGIEKYVFSEEESPMFAVESAESLQKIWRENELNVFNLDILEKPRGDFTNSYNVVINTAVIEHLKDPRIFFDNISSFLKNGGIVITMSPNLAVFYKRARFLLGLSPNWALKDFFNLGEKGFMGHWREYTMYELKKMHEWAGFRIIECINTDIFSLSSKINFRNFFHLILRYASFLAPNSREANIIIAKKVQ